eukprot:6820367-Prymnesium_polylepis.1
MGVGAGPGGAMGLWLAKKTHSSEDTCAYTLPPGLRQRRRRPGSSRRLQQSEAYRKKMLAGLTDRVLTAAQESYQASLNDFRTEAARTEEWKSEQVHGQTSGEPPTSEVFSPLMKIAQNVTSAAEQLSTAAQQRVANEWQSFESEAARSGATDALQ